VVKSVEAGARETSSTAATSAKLARWFRENGVGSQRWLEGESRWSVRLGEALLRADDPPYLVGPVWGAIESLKAPSAIIDHEEELTLLASTASRRRDVERVVEAARLAVQSMPFKQDAAWRLADLASLDSDKSVLYTNRGVLRVVARVTASTVDSTNQGSDGRIAAARLVGVEPESREANLALVVIAQSLCLPIAPKCEECPLNQACASANDFCTQIPLELVD